MSNCVVYNRQRAHHTPSQPLLHAPNTDVLLLMDFYISWAFYLRLVAETRSGGHTPRSVNCAVAAISAYPWNAIFNYELEDGEEVGGIAVGDYWVVLAVGYAGTL